MTRLLWKAIPPTTTTDLIDVLGFVVDFVDTLDERSAKEQIDANYQHGGGWRPQDKWTLSFDTSNVPSIRYPGDTPLRALAEAELRSERLYMFDYGIMAIVQPDGAFEVARLD